MSYKFSCGFSMFLWPRCEISLLNRVTIISEETDTTVGRAICWHCLLTGLLNSQSRHSVWCNWTGIVGLWGVGLAAFPHSQILMLISIIALKYC